MENGSMMGLMVLVVLVVYLLISVWVTKKAVSWAKANKKKPWLWGGLAAFVMYNLVFWDLIPTLVMHKYYCSMQAGFWVYKTPEQWVKENPHMREDVSYEEQVGATLLDEKIKNGYKTAVFLNKRTYVLSERTVTSILPILTNRKREELLFDKKNNFKLTSKITFEAGSVGGAPNSLSDFRFWINFEECDGKSGNALSDTWLNARNKFTNFGEAK